MNRKSPPLSLSCLLILLALPLPAQAAKWERISGAKDQARIEVDSSSLRSSGEKTWRVWHRESFATPRLPESGAFSYIRQTTLSEFHCDKREANTLQRRFTAVDGNELKFESFEDIDFAPVAPDSSLEAVLRYVCRSRQKPATPAKAVEPVPAPVVAPPPEPKPSAKTKSKKGKEDAAHSAPHWSYTGSTGADKWGSLDSAYATCGMGQRQSPIDIRKTVKADLPAIEFAYQPVPLNIEDNGHSIKVDTAGAGNITVEGESYDLVQFHFHKPSEEKINGKSYDMVAHLVHQSKAGKLAVVAVLMEAGKEQPLLRTLWTHLPLEQNKPVIRAEVKIDPTQILPAKRAYYTFLGSLTTPPCTEGVLWLVLKTPVQVSKEQLAGFATIYKNNVRPVQPVNGRVIKGSR